MDAEPFIIDIAENAEIIKQWARHFSPQSMRKLIGK
jgi:hypothetical protein